MESAREADSNASSKVSSVVVPAECLELIDGRVSFEPFLIEAGFDKTNDSLEGLRGGMSGVSVVRSCMRSNGVCGKAP